MKKKLGLLLVVCMLFSLFSGCSKLNQENKPVKETIKLYYASSDNEKFVIEEREISYVKDADKYQAAIEQLIAGPANTSYRNNINKQTVVYGTIKQDKDLIIDLSSDFNNFSGDIAEIIAVGSIVNTLTQFEEIERVKILVEGDEYVGPSGQPRGFMKTFANSTAAENRGVTLYFGNPDASAVSPETREINVAANIGNEEFINIVLEELIKGPESKGLRKTIPAEVKVKSVRIADNIAYLDFSGEMHSKHWRGAAGESMTINSIVNTLTEFDFIDKVKMTVEGEPLAIEHAILDEPVGRNEGMIEK